MEGILYTRILGVFIVTGICSVFSPCSFANIEISPNTKLINLAMNTVVVNPRTHRWTAIRDGKVVRSGRVSAGRKYCPDIGRSCKTPSGVYYVHYKGGPGCRSSRYPVGEGGAPMPYCMFYSKYYALHGSYDVPNYNASHGCVRMTPSDAKWLYHNFVRIGTRVVVRPY